MATDIERTIYKLEIDDSDYTKGVDKVSASTNKLTSAQTAANAKLAELQKTLAAQKKSLEEVNDVLKENEKETIALTKDLNLLKQAGAGASTEAKKLQAILRDGAVSTKEYRAEAALLKTNIQSTTAQIALQSKELKASEAASGNAAKGFTKVYSGLRTLANIIPGIGIGGLVGLIAGPLVNAFESLFDSMGKAASQQKLLEDAFTEGSYQKAITDVNSLTLNIKLAKEGFLDKTVVLKEYNDTLGKSLGHVKSLDEAEDNLVKKGPAYIQMTLLKAAANLALDKAAKATLDATLDLQKSQDAATKINEPGQAEGDVKAGAAGLSKFLSSGIKNEAQAAKEAADKRVQTLKDIAEKFRTDAAEIAKSFGISFDPIPTPKPGKTGNGRKEIVNIYEQELQKLRADIAKLDEKGFTNEATITKAVEEDFKKRSLAFDKAFKNKQLTSGQLTSLKDNLSNLQDLILNQQLKSFREQKQAYLQQINDELTNLQIEESTKRIATIQNSFERERQTIVAEAEKTIQALSQRRDKLISDVTKNAAKNGLTAADIAPQIQSIKDVYSKLLDDLGVIKNQKLQQLSFDTFEKLSEDAKRLLDAGNLGVSQGSLINIKQQAKLLAEGKISFEEYQKELTAIVRFEANERFRLERLFLSEEIKIRQDKLALDKTLTDDQVKRLEDEIRRLQQQLTDAEKGNVTANASADGKTKDPRTENIVKYAQAIGDLTQSIIQFWVKANEAESAALDKSIALQEKRVEAAQRIAERGNAQYLKAEEDRLKELTIKRENAARRELAINAALQASQLLVGITGAISKIATPGIGLAESIGAFAVIVSSLAAGYGLVKSLQGSQPRLAKGDPYVKRNGHPSGVDTIPAWLNEGEAVIPTETNKKYHPAIRAIYDEKIPAEDINAFVKNYHAVKGVPRVNYDRIKESAELSTTYDGRMSVALSEQNKLIMENNELQRMTLRAMKNMAVSATIDRDGVAISVNEYIAQMNINKKA